MFEGRLGGGKSLASTAFAVLEHANNQRKIISTNGFFGIPYEHLDYEKLIEWMREEHSLRDAVVVVDEAYLFMDSRLSQSGFSRLVSYFVMQTRKRGVDLYVCSQQFENVDIRLRKNVDVRVICRFSRQTEICTLRLIDLRTGRRRRLKLYGPEWYQFFDTNEIPSLRPFHTKVEL